MTPSRATFWRLLAQSYRMRARAVTLEARAHLREIRARLGDPYRDGKSCAEDNWFCAIMAWRARESAREWRRMSRNCDELRRIDA